jgi:hypothetical protein
MREKNQVWIFHGHKLPHGWKLNPDQSKLVWRNRTTY